MCASISPGSTVARERSITVAPAGAATRAPTLSIRLPRMTITWSRRAARDSVDQRPRPDHRDRRTGAGFAATATPDSSPPTTSAQPRPCMRPPPSTNPARGCFPIRGPAAKAFAIVAPAMPKPSQRRGLRAAYARSMSRMGVRFAPQRRARG